MILRMKVNYMGKTVIQEADGRATKRSMKDLLKVHVGGFAVGTDLAENVCFVSTILCRLICKSTLPDEASPGTGL